MRKKDAPREGARGQGPESTRRAGPEQDGAWSLQATGGRREALSTCQLAPRGLQGPLLPALALSLLHQEQPVLGLWRREGRQGWAAVPGLDIDWGMRRGGPEGREGGWGPRVARRAQM